MTTSGDHIIIKGAATMSNANCIATGAGRRVFLALGFLLGTAISPRLCFTEDLSTIRLVYKDILKGDMCFVLENSSASDIVLKGDKSGDSVVLPLEAALSCSKSGKSAISGFPSMDSLRGDNEHLVHVAAGEAVTLRISVKEQIGPSFRELIGGKCQLALRLVMPKQYVESQKFKLENNGMD
jgi:hypothetical protein